MFRKILSLVGALQWWCSLSKTWHLNLQFCVVFSVCYILYIVKCNVDQLIWCYTSCDVLQIFQKLCPIPLKVRWLHNWLIANICCPLPHSYMHPTHMCARTRLWWLWCIFPKFCQESHSESSDSPPISIGGGNRGQSVPTGVGMTGYEDRGLGTRRCPTGVGRWLVVPITKKAQAQLMCWPTNYRCLVGQRVRRAAERNGRSRGSGDKGLT